MMNKFNLKKIDLKFIEDGHCHLLNGKEVPGCTSISGLFSDDGWKFAWPVKIMEEKILAGIDEIGATESKAIIKCQRNAFEFLIKKSKNAWKEKRDSTAQKGTDLHKVLEGYIKARIDGIEVEPFLLAPEFEHQVEDFLAWEKENKVEWLASEIQVGNEDYKYAGIADCVYKIGDNIYLDDIKTSERVKDNWVIQLAGLRHAFFSMGLPINNTGILHFPRGGKFKRLDVPLDAYDWTAFISGLDFYRHKNLFLERVK